MNLFHEKSGAEIEPSIPIAEQQLLRRETYERLSSSIIDAQVTKETADSYYSDEKYSDAFKEYESIMQHERKAKKALSEYMDCANEGLPIVFHPVINGRTAEEPVIGSLEEIGQFDFDAGNGGFTGTVWYEDGDLNSRTCVIRLNNPEAFVAEPAQEASSPDSDLVSH